MGLLQAFLTGSLRSAGATGQGYRLTPAAKRWLHIAGTALFVLSLAYLVLFAARNWHEIEGLPRLHAGHLLLAGLVYALAHPSSAAAWVLGLRGMGQAIPFLTGFRIGLVAQIGKYLPGNVAHYFARGGLAATAGVKVADSGLATLLEILATFLAATLVISAAMLVDPAPAEAIHQALADKPALPVACALAAILGAALLLRLMKVPAAALFAVTACLVVSFIVVGLSFLAVVASVSGTVPSPAAVIGIYAVAWTAGYLIPGAPAGLGIREAILVAWLGPLVGIGAALACTLLHRMISAAVDALAALLGYGWLHVVGNRA